MKKNMIWPVLIILLSGCDKAELRGFFISYESADERFEQSTEWNSQAGHADINVPLETYTLHVMGDSHVGGTVNLNAFFQNAGDENVAAVIMVGDITTGHPEDYELLSAQLPPADSLTVFATPGNHDLYFDGWQHFFSLFGASSYFFVVNTPGHSDLYICLDSGGGTLGKLQYEWFKSLLETGRDHYRYCTIFTHVNLFRFRSTTSTNPMTEEMQVLLDLFLQHDVNMVITAHDHKQNSDALGNTTHIIMDALLDEYNDAGYLELSVDEESMDYRFVGL